MRHRIAPWIKQWGWFAATALTLAILGFSVVAAIQLMRTRARLAENEIRLRSEIQALQAENDRSNALLLSEPQVVVSWGAADDRPQVAGDTSLLTDGPAHRAHRADHLFDCSW